MQSALSHSSNGQTQTYAAEATELALVKQLPEETATATPPNSVSVIEELLQTLSSGDWLESSAFKQFIQKVQQSAQPQAKSRRRISILLLDAENLKLDINTETFLASLCKYPLQVKIAFANWRNPSIGRHDAELYERGYQLVHVPEGKDSADAKMIALGSSILRQYSTVKEVFVCSCDGIFTHLCNQLQNQGLTVYWVRRQNHNLKVENRNTGEVSHYSLAMETEIPSFEEFVQKLEELIKAERESLTERLSKLVTVANLFQERCNLTLNGNRSSDSPVISQEQLEAESIQSPPEKKDVQSKGSATTTSTPSAKSINSMEVLEKLLIEIIRKMTIESRQETVSVTKLKTQFQAQCKETADAIVKKLQSGSSLIKFLRSRPTLFKLALVGKEYEVKVLKEGVESRK